MTRASGHALTAGEQSSSHSSGYSEYYDTDSDDDLYADMDDAAVAARQFDDAHRDIAHFFKHHPSLGQAQAMLRAAGVHKIAQLKGLDVPVMVQRGVCERDAEVIHAALLSENPTGVCVQGFVLQSWFCFFPLPWRFPDQRGVAERGWAFAVWFSPQSCSLQMYLVLLQLGLLWPRWWRRLGWCRGRLGVPPCCHKPSQQLAERHQRQSPSPAVTHWRMQWVRSGPCPLHHS
jgi:hypothetical protein